MVRTYLSLATADALLSSITPHLRQAQQLKRTIERRERVEERVTENGLVLDIGERLDAELCELKELFYKAIDAIEARGGVLRDIEEGVVDFYTRFEGRDVFLCWQLGERRIRHWHELDEDLAGRKSIFDVRHI